MKNSTIILCLVSLFLVRPPQARAGDFSAPATTPMGRLEATRDLSDIFARDKQEAPGGTTSEKEATSQTPGTKAVPKKSDDKPTEKAAGSATKPSGSTQKKAITGETSMEKASSGRTGSGRARLGLADSLWRQGQKEKALGLWKELAAKNPATWVTEQARLRLVRYGELSAKDPESLVGTLPEGDARTRARFILAERWKDPVKRRENYGELAGNSRTPGRWRVLSRLRLAGQAWRENRPGGVLASLEPVWEDLLTRGDSPWLYEAAWYLAAARSEAGEFQNFPLAKKIIDEALAAGSGEPGFTHPGHPYELGGRGTEPNKKFVDKAGRGLWYHKLLRQRERLKRFHLTPDY